MMYLVSPKEKPDHRVWISAGQRGIGRFDDYIVHAERDITADDMLDWIDADWPSIEVDATGTTIARLEPTQGEHNMFRGRNVREALLKSMITPAFKGPNPIPFDAMTEEEQLEANKL